MTRLVSFTLHWLSVVATLLGSTGRAHASDVVLLAPPAGDAFIEEVFHRVRGELRVQAIDFEQRDDGSQAGCAPFVQPVVGGPTTRACIAFEWHDEACVVRVWVTYPSRTEPALFEAVALARSAEVPTLLATRTVDSLKAALAAPVRPSPISAPRPTLRPDHDEAIPAETPRRSWLELGFAELGASSRFGAAWGPQIGFFSRLTERFRFGARVVAPLLGAREDNVDASAELTRGLGALQLDATLIQLGPLSMSAHLGAGPHLLHVRGSVARGIASIVPVRETHWSPAVLAGAGASLGFAARWALRVDATALFVFPPPRVIVARESAQMATPGLLLCAGLRWAF